MKMAAHNGKPDGPSTDSVQSQTPSSGKTLPYSQRNALMNLLCLSRITHHNTSHINTPTTGIASRRFQIYYGEFNKAKCKEMRTPDILLLSFGGNDVGFSGVVMNQLLPIKARDTFWNPIWGITRKIIGTLKPRDADKATQKHLPILTAHLSNDMKYFTRNTSIIYNIYPDPVITSKNLHNCGEVSHDGNTMITSFAELKSKSLARPDIGASNQRLINLSNEFITPLRNTQFAIAKKMGWTALDSNVAMLLPRTLSYCGTPNSTDGKRLIYNTSDNYSFQETYPSYSSPTTLSALSDFKAYNNAQTRGFRTGNDAFLSGAAIHSNNKFKDDWVTLSSHPTASVHARMADLLLSTALADNK